MVGNAVLTEGDLRSLQEALAKPVAPPACRYRGCQSVGEFYLRRMLRAGQVQSGLYCGGHEEQFGEANLRKWAREYGGQVAWLTDAEGSFRGVVLPTWRGSSGNEAM